MNDNSPVLLFPAPGRDTAYIPSDAPPGRLVTTLLAADSDAGLNGSVAFELDDRGHPPGHQTHSQLFYIDSDTGGVYVNSSLVSSAGLVHRVPVVVRDHGVPPRSGSPAVLKIHVTPPAGADRSSLAQLMTSSTSRIVVAVVVTIVTLLVVAALLVAIVVCRPV